MKAGSSRHEGSFLVAALAMKLDDGNRMMPGRQFRFRLLDRHLLSLPPFPAAKFAAGNPALTIAGLW